VADKKISALTAVTTPAAGDLFPAESADGSTNYKYRLDQLSGDYTALPIGTTVITIGAEKGYWVWGVGPGGPGGGGARQSNAANSSGGAGGGAGSSTWPPIFLPVALFGNPGDTFNAVVPAAPAGGLAAAADSTKGDHGSNAADTTFGPFTIGFHGTYGEGGQLAAAAGRGSGASEAAAGGNPVGGTGGATAIGSSTLSFDGIPTNGVAAAQLQGGNGGAGASGNVGAGGANSHYAGAGGGAGGGQASAVSKNGGPGGVCAAAQITTASAGSTSSASPGTNGSSATAFPGQAGSAGGGGFGNGSGAGTNGGDGGTGCGGGGGGSAVNGNAAGDGGKGGPGALCFVRVF
jgi:hypothetical protein